LLSLWLLVRSIRVPHTGWAVGLAALAGVALGVTTSLKTVILLPALLVLLHLATAAWRYRWGRLPLVLSLASLTLLVTITPLFVRATRLRGKFTPISTNGPLDVMMGHRGRIRLFHFVDRSRNYRSMFGSPVALQKGYTEELRLPFAPYDVEQMLEEAWVWTRANPWLALQLSAEHVTELFYGSVPWPSSHATPRSSRYR
ncbi:MAG: hypothetical protein GTO03_06715, partial [Planctomycetales bacterium]|nr:hypothetical protein [Planctomycetales bacterium]